MSNMGLKTKSKQIFISSIYLVIILLIVFAIYSCVKPVPNCFDGKLNQDEKGVDCGGVCAKKCALVSTQDIRVVKTGLVESGVANKYDLYAQIENPNSLLGSSEFQYEFKVEDATGQVVAQRAGTRFILPGETKYVIELNVETSGKPERTEFSLSNVKWNEFSSYQKPQIEVVNKVYNVISDGVGFGEAKGLLKNESEFDFSTIDVGVILKDGNGEVLALNTTSMNTVKSGENRDFSAFWPDKFSGDVEKVEVQAEVNVFKSDSFVKRYFPLTFPDRRRPRIIVDTNPIALYHHQKLSAASCGESSIL